MDSESNGLAVHLAVTLATASHITMVFVASSRFRLRNNVSYVEGKSGQKEATSHENPCENKNHVHIVERNHFSRRYG